MVIPTMIMMRLLRSPWPFWSIAASLLCLGNLQELDAPSSLRMYLGVEAFTPTLPTLLTNRMCSSTLHRKSSYQPIQKSLRRSMSACSGLFASQVEGGEASVEFDEEDSET